MSSRQAKPPAGDATGREKAKLEAQHRPSIEEAATAVSLTSAPVVEHTDEIVDYSGGGTKGVDTEPGVRTLTIEEALGDGSTVHTVDDLPASALSQQDLDDLPDGRTDTRPEYVGRTEEPQPAAKPPSQMPQSFQAPPQVAQVAAPVVEQAFRLMRVNTDLPDVTIGKDNHFTFRENQRYKVPQYVYDHLEEKGYVYH